MEEFGAQDERPLKECLDAVERGDVFVASTPTATGLCPTASKSRSPRLSTNMPCPSPFPYSPISLTTDRNPSHADLRALIRLWGCSCLE
jgi:hypothetical protein